MSDFPYDQYEEDYWADRKEIECLRAVNAQLLTALKMLLDAVYDTVATGIPCITLEPAMEVTIAIIAKAEEAR